MAEPPTLDIRVLQREKDFALLGLDGQLAGESRTDRIREVLEEHYIDDGVKRIRLDLSRLSFMDLEGVATLLMLRKESEQRGKRLTIEGAGGQVRQKLQVSGVLSFLEGG